MDTPAAPARGARTPAAALAERLALPPWIVPREVMEHSGHRELWSGRDRRRGVDVVLKVVPPDRRAHLEAEARALARLGAHPHVVALSAVGTAPDGSGWLATDLAAQGTLADQPRPAPARALRWASQLAEALAHAHGRGVVHGDLTPANVLLDARGRVLLGDFGAASLSTGSGPEPQGGGHPGGHTPRFAAPERRRGGRATTASDVYGFGATVAHLLGPGFHVAPRRARRLLRRSLEHRPARRPRAAELAGRLRAVG